jgi:hypothetical protein
MNKNLKSYYRDCFGKVGGKWYWVRDFKEAFPNFNDDGDVVNDAMSAFCYDEKGRAKEIPLNNEDAIEFPLLPPHYRSDGYTAWWFSRRPVREKEKGMCFKNISVETPVNSFIPRKIKLEPPTESYAKLLKLLNKKPQAIPINFAMRVLDRGAICVPINLSWALSWSFNKKFDFTLFRRLKPVGLLKADMSGAPLSGLYKQELKDLFPTITWK